MGTKAVNGTSSGALVARCLAGLLVTLAAVAPPASADTIPAGACEPATGGPTIQQAVNAAKPGDTVQVCRGVYREQVTVDRNDITIVSRDGPAETVISSPGYAGFVVRAPDVTIGDPAHGFTIQPTQHGVDVVADDPGVEADRARIEGNRVVGFSAVGISIDMGADDVHVVANTVTQTLLTSVLSPGSGGAPAGIAVNVDGNPNHQTPTNRAQILDNTIVA